MIPRGPGMLPYNGGVPRHWNCRSAEIPVTKTWEELGIKGIGETNKGWERASMFGPVKATTTFDDWLRKQSAAIQDDALGSRRLGDAFRSGQLQSTKQMVNAAENRPLRMREMEAMGLIPPRGADMTQLHLVDTPNQYLVAHPEARSKGREFPGQWGEFSSLEDLRNAIMFELNDPDSDYNQFDSAIEQLEDERAELRDRLNRGQAIPGLYTKQQQDQFRARIKDIETEITATKARRDTFIAERYLAPLTSGRADNFNIPDPPNGYSDEEKALIHRANDVFRDLAGETSSVNQVYNEPPEQWMEDVWNINGRRRTWREHFYKPGDVPTFTWEDPNLGRVTEMWGGTSQMWGRLGTYEVNSALHELAHSLEVTSSANREASLRYLRWRLGSAWGDASKLSSQLGNKFSFADLESTHRLVYGYMATMYGHNLTDPVQSELISAGIEWMSRFPREFLTYDPETFDFLCHFLTGRADDFFDTVGVP